MSTASYLAAPFAQPSTQGTPLPKISDAPVMIALPVAPGASDQTMIAEGRLRMNHRDGAELSILLRKVIMRAPAVADKIIAAANLGRESERQAAEALRIFGKTKIAVVPESL